MNVIQCSICCDVNPCSLEVLGVSSDDHDHDGVDGSVAAAWDGMGWRYGIVWHAWQTTGGIE